MDELKIITTHWLQSFKQISLLDTNQLNSIHSCDMTVIVPMPNAELNINCLIVFHMMLRLIRNRQITLNGIENPEFKKDKTNVQKSLFDYIMTFWVGITNKILSYNRV